VARKCGPVSVGFSRLVTTLLGYLVLGTTEGKDTSFIPPKGGGLLSLFSHTDGKIRDGYGEDGCGRKVVGTERLILTQHSPYL
jgi:hypothetical protein